MSVIHVFEKAGLGKAPFKFAGMVYQNIQYGQRVIGSVRGVEITTKPGGTCDYCGTYIVNMFNVESADGNKFHVGCECIRKAGDAGLMKVVDESVAVAKKQAREAARVAKVAAEKSFCLEYKSRFFELFDRYPHPSGFYGKTLFDYAVWNFENGNYATVARLIRELAPKPAAAAADPEPAPAGGLFD